jgi:hypothetical protein
MTPTRVVLNDLWESLWQQQNRGCFDTETVRRDSNPVEGVYVPTTINVLRLSEVLIRIGDIMIREEYREAIVDIERLRTAESPRTGVVIVGHPGIGTTTGSVRSMGTDICSTVSRQNHLFVLHFG